MVAKGVLHPPQGFWPKRDSQIQHHHPTPAPPPIATMSLVWERG